MRIGHTYTRHFDLETRQHELFGVDLGEGPPRRMLIVGFLAYIIWAGSLLLIFGLPNKVSFTLYFVPPGLITYYGAQRSRRNDRRYNVTQWALTIRYLTRGHRPIINGGRRAAERSEWLPLRARLGERAEALLEAPGMGLLEPLIGSSDIPKTPAGRSVTLRARPRLYGPDQVYKARKRRGGARTN